MPAVIGNAQRLRRSQIGESYEIETPGRHRMRGERTEEDTRMFANAGKTCQKSRCAFFMRSRDRCGKLSSRACPGVGRGPPWP